MRLFPYWLIASNNRMPITLWPTILMRLHSKHHINLVVHIVICLELFCTKYPMPLLLTWIGIHLSWISNYINYNVYNEITTKLQLHPLTCGNWYVISSHTSLSLGMWVLIRAGIKFNPCLKWVPDIKCCYVSNLQQRIVKMRHWIAQEWDHFNKIVMAIYTRYFFSHSISSFY